MDDNEQRKDQLLSCMLIFMYMAIGFAVGSFAIWFLASP